MRTLSTSQALVFVIVVTQMVMCLPEPRAQRPRFLDNSPFSQLLRPQEEPSPSASMAEARSQRQLLLGPPIPSLNGPSQEHKPGDQEFLSLGQLPLNPRPVNLEEAEFDGPPLHRQEFSGQEDDSEGGFVPVLPGDAVENEDEGSQSLDDQHSHVEERSSPGSILDTIERPDRDQTGYPQGEDEKEEEVLQSRQEPSILEESLFSDPGHPFTGGQRLEEQETQGIEILSAPPPINNIRKRNTVRPHRPAHPNQIPVYHEVYNQDGELVEEGEELEEEEPDRLAILLLESKFSCMGKNNGYYADEQVNCEVFHYCQDRVKHSWLCPEGASFHQVHLICMPRSEDNICERSSTFHFVNDFLYKELEGPNKTYAERYYPEGFADGVGVVRLDQQQQQQQQQQDVGASAGGDGYQSNRFPGTLRTRRPTTAFHSQPPPPTYQPEVVDVEHSGQTFQSGQSIDGHIQQHSVPDFQQSSQHFSGVIGQDSSSFQPIHDFGDNSSQGQFTAFHSPEEVRVQRPRPRPHLRPGRRPGNFNRHQVQLG